MKKILMGVAYFCLVAAQSCEHPRVVFGGEPDTPYHKTLTSLTQYQKLFALDKTQYETFATYVSPALAIEYVNEYARAFVLPEDEKAKMIAQAQEDLEKFDDFYVAHYASERDSQNLTEQSPSKVVWKFFIQDPSMPGTMLESQEIKQIALGAQREYFFPHLTGWNRLYKVRFPKIASPSKTLYMKGPIKEVRFDWK